MQSGEEGAPCLPSGRNGVLELICLQRAPVFVLIILPSRATACPTTVPSSRRQRHPTFARGINGMPSIACPYTVSQHVPYRHELVVVREDPLCPSVSSNQLRINLQTTSTSLRKWRRGVDRPRQICNVHIPPLALLNRGAAGGGQSTSPTLPTERRASP